MVKIREATIDDLFEIADMWDSMRVLYPIVDTETDGRERERYFVQTVARLYLSNWKILVADDNGIIKGFMTGENNMLNCSNIPRSSCRDLYVKPEYRGSKIGHLLTEGFYSWAKESKSKFADFQTVYSEKLIRRWQKHGWEPVRVIYKKEVCNE